MFSDCPECNFTDLVEQDIEALSDSVLLVKTFNRMQLRCPRCGWMGYGELVVKIKNGTTDS